MVFSPVRVLRSPRRVARSLPIVGLILSFAATVDASPAFGPKEYTVRPGLPLPAIERFPACRPEQGGQLRVENGPHGLPRATLAGCSRTGRTEGYGGPGRNTSRSVLPEFRPADGRHS